MSESAVIHQLHSGQYDPEALQASLERLLALGLWRVHPGHGAPIDDVDAWLRRSQALKQAGKWPTKPDGAETVAPGG